MRSNTTLVMPFSFRRSAIVVPISSAPLMLPPSTPLAYLGPEAPPFLVIHGANDTMVPVASARALADGLRAAASAPVVMAELPGAQHSFDLFTAWVLSRRAGPTRPSLTSPGSRPPG